MFLYENTHALRMLKRYTQKYIADELGISQSYYSSIEQGKSDIPVSLLLKICNLYDIPVQVLMFTDIKMEANKFLHH